jgi:polar amino acid transport system substrate-binding protein
MWLDRGARLCFDLQMHSYRRLLACSALWLAFVCTIAGCRSTLAPTEPLVVASDLDNQPFAYVDEHGAPAGRDVEMMHELARRIGRELEWKRMPFDELLPAVERGDVDVVCATLGITPERAVRVAFSRPYFQTRIVLLQRADHPLPLEIPTAAKLSGGAGTTAERAIRLHAPQAELVHAEKQDRTALERLEAGELDGIALDEPAARARAAASHGRLSVRERPLCGESYALVLPLAGSVLCAELDAALARLESSGWLSALDARHGLR